MTLNLVYQILVGFIDSEIMRVRLLVETIQDLQVQTFVTTYSMTTKQERCFWWNVRALKEHL